MFTATVGHNSVSVFENGDFVGYVDNNDNNFQTIRTLVLSEKYDEAVQLLPAAVTKKALESSRSNRFRSNIYTQFGHVFAVQEDGESVYLDGALGSLLRDFIANHGFVPESYVNFVTRLLASTSYRVRTQLYEFMRHNDYQITEDGMIVCYKVVRSDMKDKYTGKIDNSVGKTIEMARVLVNDDPNVACAAGLHVGTMNYMQGYGNSGDVYISVLIDPADVVSIPVDHSYEKMRVCRYIVLGVVSEEEISARTEVFSVNVAESDYDEDDDDDADDWYWDDYEDDDEEDYDDEEEEEEDDEVSDLDVEVLHQAPFSIFVIRTED